jgi:hypothetical protein
LEARTVHSVEKGVVLAIDVASVQKMETPVQGTDEVRSTNGREPVEEMGDALAPRTKDQTPEGNGAKPPTCHQHKLD